MRVRDMFSDMNKLIEVALNIANYVDREGIKNIVEPMCDSMGLGFGTMSNYLRKGAKACIDMQNEYRSMEWSKKRAVDSENDARDFLEEIFGDREPECINDKDKAKIIEFCHQIYEEWENGEE